VNRANEEQTMSHRIDRIFFALVASIGFAAAVQAQRAPSFETIEVAAEVLAGQVTLPSGPDSSLVMPGCGGCAPKSFPATRSTMYFVGKQQVTLAELAAAIGARPRVPLTVSYSVNTGELTRITADIEPPSSVGHR
jgi:hypothetical protein